MSNYKFLFFFIVLLVSGSVHAERFWTNTLEGWIYYLNNGVGYISSTSFPNECTYNRAQINFNSEDEYMKNIAAYVLAASKTGEKLAVVLDHDRSASADSITCVVLSAKASK